MLGSLLSLGRSLSETSDSEPADSEPSDSETSEPEWLLESSLPEVELLVERDSESDSLWLSDVESLRLPESDPLFDAESL